MASGKVRLAGLLLGACVLGIGCQQVPRWPANGFMDPSQVGRFPTQSVPQNIQSVVSIMDEPLDIAVAAEPTAADLEPSYKDYVLGAGDMIRVTIFELLAEGTESTFDRQISESGYVSIPVLGSVKVGGLTAREAEVHLADLLQPEIIRNPRVAVVTLDRRHQTMEMLGAFVAPGSYVIPRPNFRLLDAIALARDLQPGIETIYVLRSYDYQEPSAAQTQPAANAGAIGGNLAGGPGAAGGESAMGGPGGSAARTPGALPDAGLPREPGAGVTSGAPGIQATPNESELQGVMGTTGGAAGQMPAVARKPIYIEGQWVEVPATTSAPMAASGPAAEGNGAAAAGTPASTGATTAEVDWASAVTEGSRQRVLRIPVREMMRGDPRFNVVIRANDKVYAWLGPVGEFYVNGNVYRPGAFTLTGRKITVRQAIISAGGLSPLAIPERCELIRRYKDDQEEIIRLNLDAIFAGTQPDVVLKPNDVINVGTNAVAPFMATVRNAFRLTYGFGFVYDRNFADIDSYSSKENPQTIRAAKRASQFGALFR